MQKDSISPGESDGALLVEASPVADVDSKRLRWFEVDLVMTIVFGGNVLNSLFLLQNGIVIQPVPHSSRWAAQFVQEIAGLMLLGYVLWRGKRRIRDLGFVWSFRELGAGVLVTIVAYLAYAVGFGLVSIIFRALLPASSPAPDPKAIFGHLPYMAVPVFLLNPFFEELIVRAYLMSEIRFLTGSWLLAGVVSVFIQFSYHLYYGWQGALSLSFQFMVFAIYYAKTRKATPIVFAHGVFDIVGLLRLW